MPGCLYQVAADTILEDKLALESDLQLQVDKVGIAWTVQLGSELQFGVSLDLAIPHFLPQQYEVMSR